MTPTDPAEMRERVAKALWPNQEPLLHLQLDVADKILAALGLDEDGPNLLVPRTRWIAAQHALTPPEAE